MRRLLLLLIVCASVTAEAQFRSRRPIAEPIADASCAVSSIVAWKDTLPNVSQGMDWSRKAGRDRVAFAALDGESVFQVFIIDADGTSNLTQITDLDVEGAPPGDRHCGVPHFFPTSDLLVVQCEEPDHAVDRAYTTPGSGREHNVWVTNLTGSQWWKLTDYDIDSEQGVLFGQPNATETLFAWAERYDTPDDVVRVAASLLLSPPQYDYDYAGRWRMNVSALTVSNGVPSIGNPSSSALHSGAFFEFQGFGETDDRLIVASTPYEKQFGYMDVWEYDWADEDWGRRKALLASNGEFEEHLAVSPDRTKALFSRSGFETGQIGNITRLKGEAYIAEYPSLNYQTPITSFNTVDGTFYNALLTQNPTSLHWNRTGDKAIVNVQRYVTATPATRDTKTYLITFAGQCGA